MGKGSMEANPIEASRLYNNPEVVEIFQQYNWIDYFNRLYGYDDNIVMEFSLNFHHIRDQEYSTSMKGLYI